MVVNDVPDIRKAKAAGNDAGTFALKFLGQVIHLPRLLDQPSARAGSDTGSATAPRS